jgi:phosphoribosyl 1,2-cyclic phosphodiesterase
LGKLQPGQSEEPPAPGIVLVRTGATITIDTSPDLRLQPLDAKVSKIDAVLYTTTMPTIAMASMSSGR